jgi:DNA topoisomerase I
LLTQLVHRGVLVPDKPAYHKLTLRIRGAAVALSPEAEEMAVAWARKVGTPYVSDPVFARNFLEDWARWLGVRGPLRLADVDFGPALAVVQAEREARERQSPEERKQLAAERRERREALRNDYGHAVVNGERVELGNYQVEPSGIFMGRGQHPLRGRWKRGAERSDITLNLSPDAPVPEGEWHEIVWQPESLWVARWQDKLTGKIKYIWLSDTASVKQTREAGKFDKATELDAHLPEVLAHIEAGLTDAKPKRRRVATVCALIDVLNLRVGDEKDPDEADTVGATTLRPEHVTIHPDGVVEFRFLGKDSVLWHKKVRLTDAVRANLEELLGSVPQGEQAAPSGARGSSEAKPQVFPDITSRHVNQFLGEVLPGLTAKVFRTHHATRAVRQCLGDAGVTAEAPDYEKWRAVAMANLDAAIICNHTRQAGANWKERRERLQERRAVLKARADEAKGRWSEAADGLKAVKAEARAKAAAATDPKKRTKVKETYRRKIDAAEVRAAAARARADKAVIALDRFDAQSQVAGKMRTWNPSTSLKSYIDPRVFYRWGQGVGYDVLDKYYPKTMQRKFQWVREACDSEMEDEGSQERTEADAE